MPKNPAPWQKLARVNAHPRDLRIEFVEDTHTYYIDGDSTNIMSTTTFIHSFFGHFDPDAIIAKMMNSPKWQQSKYYGMTPEQIKKQWADNGASASESGTAMHLAIEQYYNEAYDVIDPAIYETTEWKYFMKFYKKYGERYKMTCGCLDLLTVCSSAMMESSALETGRGAKKSSSAILSRRVMVHVRFWTTVM
jgi:hypothetical protein